MITASCLYSCSPNIGVAQGHLKILTSKSGQFGVVFGLLTFILLLLMSEINTNCDKVVAENGLYFCCNAFPNDAAIIDATNLLIDTIKSTTGHYKPTNFELMRMLRFLRENHNVDLKTLQAWVFNPYVARAWRDSSKRFNSLKPCSVAVRRK